MSRQDKINLWMYGCSGRMGRTIQEILESESGFHLVGASARRFEKSVHFQGQDISHVSLARALEDVDLILDFSTPQANKLLLDIVNQSSLNNKAFLIGTTALSEKTMTLWQTLPTKSKHRVLVAPNTSLGVLLLSHLSQIATKLLSSRNYDIEILESHHRNKKDSPSGTAIYLGEQLVKASHKNLKLSPHRGNRARKEDEIGVHSIRGGQVFGEHQVQLLGDHEELIFTHRALSRKLFAQGALVLGRWLHCQNAGFYRLDDVDLTQI